MHRRLVSARLITLLRLARESVAPEYDRRVGLNDLNRQILTMIGAAGGLCSNELVVRSGHEKAQISRAVKALEADDLIERTSLRAPLMLRPEGQRRFDVIMSIARARDAILTAGISAPMRRDFVTMTRALTVRAAQIYAEERGLATEPGVVVPPPHIPLYGPVEDPHGIGKLIIPQLNALTSYLRRSAMLAYQREQGLSNFQWMILSQIGEYQPLQLARLIEIMGRDKSQVGRSVAHFEEAGLIERRRVTHKRDIMVTTTPRGAEVYQAMCVIAIRRDNALTAGHSAAKRAAYVGMLDRFEAKARIMLAEAQRA